MENKFSPTDLVSAMNQTLEYGYSNALIEGEVASFKINQGKWVFFDLKDEESSVSCFMTLYQMRVPLEDGMKVIIRGTPKVTKWGKLSITVQAIQPTGEGSLKKAYEALKKRLSEEGLFEPKKKRGIPDDLTRIGVISSVQAAGYADFVKIVNSRWGGLKIQVAHTQVQGLDAPDQIIRALKYFNEKNEVQIIAIIRGGGSADDLACFNDEELVRAVAASKIPVITGIGHEVDESLVDLAADIRASTPSNVAELLTPDKESVLRGILTSVDRFLVMLVGRIDEEKRREWELLEGVSGVIGAKIANLENIVSSRIKILYAHNPEEVLRRGYAILSGDTIIGNVVKITTVDKEIKAEIKEIYEKR